MTEEEARQAIKEAYGNSEYTDEIIKALEQKPCDVFDEYGDYKYPSDVELTEPNTATSMPCDDEYIKVPKKALKFIQSCKMREATQEEREGIDQYIDSIAEPCEDVINKQAAIDALGEKPLAWVEGEYELGLQNQWENDVNAIKTLLPAQPKTGHWIDTESGQECSECGHREPNERFIFEDINFCVKCGAKMIDP